MRTSSWERGTADSKAGFFQLQMEAVEREEKKILLDTKADF
jgi:hypothetical protein